MRVTTALSRLKWGLGATLYLVGACSGARLDAPDAAPLGGTIPGAEDAGTSGHDGIPQGSVAGQQTCPSAIAALSVSDGWASAPATQPAVDQLQFEIMARPGSANLDGLVAIGGQDMQDPSAATIAVRFTDNGLIDAIDGSVYHSDTIFEYEGGDWYSIVISADITNQTYDVAVGRCGQAQEPLIRDASFGANSSDSDELSTWGLWSSQPSTLEVSVPAWTSAGSCAPASCSSLGHECGTPADGCGDDLRCGPCAENEACSSGVCVKLPISSTKDIGQLIRENAAGGIVVVPDGTYTFSNIEGFIPAKPLVLVAESKHGVVVTRPDDVQEGDTDFHLVNVHDIAFAGFYFKYVTLRLSGSSGVHLWYTFHTYPPEMKPRPRHKVCGQGRAPEGILMENVTDLKFHGIDFDDIGCDGLKISSVRAAQVVGARFVNIDHRNYQTDTTSTEAAGCGHQPDDKFYHSDAIQISPGDVHDFIVSDSYTERQMMLQVAPNGESVSGFRIQDSWLSNPTSTWCIPVDTRVKADDETMELTIVDSTSWCEDKPPRLHFYTRGTKSGHNLMLGNITYETSKFAASPTPADNWRTAFPYEAWGCFVHHDVGWIELGAPCAHSGFPSFDGPSSTVTNKVVHSYE